jgi:sterol desaturase/sphingolipid hydroxylase (fatty acid hydroxylase superfamily)
MRRALEYMLYPALFGGGMLVWAVLWKQGGWYQGRVATTIVYWAFLAVLLVLERVRPFEPEWNRSDGQVPNDIALTIIEMSVVPPLSILALAALAWAIGRYQPLISLKVWPAHWPFFAQLIVGIIVYDFGNYLAHRWSHTVPLLWRFHAVHHSAGRLSVINAGRTHPIDAFKYTLIGSPVPILLGVPGEIAMWYGGMIIFGGLLTHCNIDMPCGVFNYVLNTPDQHRWHHSRNQRETDTNYGEVTMLWDLMLGTFIHPHKHPPRDVGVDVPVSTRLVQQLIQPLTPAGHRPGQPTIPALSRGEAGVHRRQTLNRGVVGVEFTSPS